MPDEPGAQIAAPEPEKDAAGGIPPMFQDLLPVAALWFAVVVGIVFVALFFRGGEASPDDRVEIVGYYDNGVPILNMSKQQTVKRVSSGKPLNEGEVKAVFRWVTENPEAAARLSPEEKANIIRALNE